MQPLALRPRDAAKLLGVCSRTLWAWTQPRGPIPCVRLGEGPRPTVLYVLEDLQEFLRRASRQQAGAQAAERQEG